MVTVAFHWKLGDLSGLRVCPSHRQSPARFGTLRKRSKKGKPPEVAVENPVEGGEDGRGADQGQHDRRHCDGNIVALGQVDSRKQNEHDAG